MNHFGSLPLRAFSPKFGKGPFAYGMTLHKGGNVFEDIGSAVSDVGESVGGAIGDVGSFIDDAVIQPAIQDPVGTVVKIAAIAAAPATGGTSLYAIPAYAAAKGVAAGLPIEDVAFRTAVSAAATAAGVEVGDYIGTMAEYGTELGSQQTAMLAAQNAGIGTGSAVSTTVGQVAGGAVSGGVAAGATGGDIGQGLLGGAINAGIGSGVGAAVDTGAGMFSGNTNTGNTNMDELFGPTYSESGYDPYANLNAGDAEAQQGGYYGGPGYGYQPENPYANMSDAELTAALASQNGSTPSTAMNLIKQFGSQAVRALLGGAGTAAQRASIGLGQNTGLGNLFGGAAGLYLSGQNKQAVQNAYNAQAQKVGTASTQAQNLASFTPIGTTNFFGSSNFGFDPATGKLTSAGTTPTSQVSTQLQNLFNLGTSALPTTTNTQDLQQQYIAQQRGLLAPSREQTLSQLQNRQYQRGTGGLATGGTISGYAPNAAGLMATNPELAAYFNSLAQQDAQLAANAPTYAQSLLDKQIATGTGLFGSANTLQGYANQPLTLSTDLAKAQAAAGASAGQLGLTGQTNAAQLAASGSLLGNAAMQGTYNQLGQVASGIGNQVGGMLLQNPTIANWLS